MSLSSPTRSVRPSSPAQVWRRTRPPHRRRRPRPRRTIATDGDVQATLEELGIARADLIAASTIRNPIFEGEMKGLPAVFHPPGKRKWRGPHGLLRPPGRAQDPCPPGDDPEGATGMGDMM